MKVTWDESKNRANQAKHGVSFQDTIRLISARWATKREHVHYRTFMEHRR